MAIRRITKVETIVTYDDGFVETLTPTGGPVDSRPEIGVGLEPMTNFDTSACWTNAFNGFGGGGQDGPGWGHPDRPWEVLPGLQLTPNAYPLADAGTSGKMTAYPAGRYLFSKEGSGTPTFSAKLKLVAPGVVE